MQTHDLKCLPNYYDAIERGEKPFEVRRDDRGFQKGDVLELRRYDPKTDYYRSGLPTIRRRVTYILTGGQLGVEPGFVIMGLEAVIPDA